jgi:hypothetical protein
MGLSDGYQMGLIAQDVEKVFPELVSNVPVPKRPGPEDKEKKQNASAAESGKSFYGVDYIQFIPLLIKAIQEQQEQIVDLQTEIASLKGKK